MKHVALAALLAAAAACSPAAENPPPAAPVESAQPPAANPAADNAGVTPSPSGEGLNPAGWAPLQIGMTLEQVTATLGPDANPDAVGGADPEACDQFRPERAPEGLLVMIERGKLTRISAVRQSTLKTDRGFGIGDAADAIKTAYGAQATVTPHKYQAAPAEYITVWQGGPRSESYVQDENARGVVYEIGGDGKVSAIHVGGPSIQYVEGCS